MRNDDSARRNVRVRFSETGLPNIGSEIISEIRAVCYVKNLKDRLEVRPFPDLEVLRDAGVKLEERLTAKIVKGINCTRPSADAIAVLDSVSIRETWIAKRIEGGG